MGRPRKPRPLKLVAGTDRPDRQPAGQVELPLVSRIPDPPDWLPNAHATKEWKRLAPTLNQLGLLTDAGLSAFGHLCALHGMLVQLWSANMTPTGHMMAQYRNLVNDFGLTPVAQGKVRPSGEKAKANKFSGIGKKKR